MACLGISAASAQVTAGPAIGGAGSCPDPAEVARIVATLLRTVPSSVPTSVEDLGSGYRVTVGGISKTYEDPGRGCLERARVAAAFIALSLTPNAASGVPGSGQAASTGTSPGVPEHPEARHADAPEHPEARHADAGAPPPVATAAPSHASPAAPPPPEPSSTEPRRWARADAAAWLALDPGGPTVAWGGGLGGSLGWRWLGVAASCGWLAPARVRTEGRSGSWTYERWPCAVQAVVPVTSPESPFDLRLSAGASLGAIRVAGEGFFDSATGVRVEAGLRAGLVATFFLPRGRAAAFAPTIGADLTYTPWPYRLRVGSGPAIAETPEIWVTFAVGIAWMSR